MEITPPVKKETVDHQIEVNGKIYTIESELVGNDLELICPICVDLISPKARQCQECGVYVCARDHEILQTQKMPCPNCRCDIAGFTDANLKFRINNLQWFCPKGCGSTRDLINIEAHICNCDGGEEYECENPGCEYTGSYSAVQTHEAICGFSLIECSHEGCQEHLLRQNLEEHELTCKWRLVSLGPIKISAWQKDLIGKYCINIPGNITPENIQNEAQFLVSLLVNKINSMGSSEECDIEAPVRSNCCQGCSEEFSAGFLEAHERECNKIKTECDYCKIIIKKAELGQHNQLCKMYPMQYSIQECDYTQPRKNLLQLQDHEHQHCLQLNGIVLNNGLYLPDSEKNSL